MVIMYVRILRIRLNQGIQDQSKFPVGIATFSKEYQLKTLSLHTDQIFIEMFQNHDFKEWISLKIMLFWLYKVIMPIFMYVK
jgi:hypothetical protein